MRILNAVYAGDIDWLPPSDGFIAHYLPIFARRPNHIDKLRKRPDEKTVTPKNIQWSLVTDEERLTLSNADEMARKISNIIRKTLLVDR